MRTEVAEQKLDPDLADLLRLDFVSAESPVPVVLRPRDSDLDCVAKAVEAVNGTVRHILKRYNAVAAWLPIGGINELAQRECIRFIELDQPAHIA